MNIYRDMLAHAGKIQIAFDAPGEGTPAAPAPAPEPTPAPAPTPAPEPIVTADPKPTDPKPVTPAADPAPVAADPALAAEKAELLREVMDKKSKLTAAQDALAAYDGVDPAKVKALLKAERDAESAAAEAKGDFERVKQMMADEHTKEVERLNAEIAALKESDGSKASLIDKLTVGNDFGGSTFIRDKMNLSPSKARTVYGSHFEVRDGRTVAFDKPSGETSRTMLVDASGNPMSFDAALERIVSVDPDKATILRADVNPGSSSKTTPASSATPKPKDNGLRGASRIAAGLADL